MAEENQEPRSHISGSPHRDFNPRKHTYIAENIHVGLLVKSEIFSYKIYWYPQGK